MLLFNWQLTFLSINYIILYNLQNTVRIHSCFPFHEHSQLAIELGGALVLGRCPDDDAKVLWLDALNKLFESASLFASLNLG